MGLKDLAPITQGAGEIGLAMDGIQILALIVERIKVPRKNRQLTLEAFRKNAKANLPATALRFRVQCLPVPQRASE